MRTSASKREGSIESKCSERALMELKVDCLKISGARGWPDRMYMIPGGRPLFIEWKKPGCEPRGNQKLRLYRLYQSGYSIAVCESVEEGLEHVRSMVEQAGAVQSKPIATARELLQGDWRRVLGMDGKKR